jgi:hypothetical protein
MPLMTRFGMCLAFLCPTMAHADGGRLLVSKASDGYRISLFTSPNSPRAGVVDFSVLVQAADGDAPLLDVPVTVHAHPAGAPERQIGGQATTAAATNKLFRAISLNLSEPGRWHIEVTAGQSEHLARVEADLEIWPPLPSWINLATWIGWPVAAILFFAVHVYLVRRSCRCRPSLK